MTLTLCEIDLQVGGSWCYILRDPINGTNLILSGEYLEILPPQRLVTTECYGWVLTAITSIPSPLPSN